MSTLDEPKVQELKDSPEDSGIVPTITAQTSSTVEAEEGVKPLDAAAESTATDDKSNAPEQKADEDEEDEEDEDEDEDDEEDEDEDTESKSAGDDAVVYPRRFIPKGRPNKGTAGPTAPGGKP